MRLGRGPGVPRLEARERYQNEASEETIISEEENYGGGDFARARSLVRSNDGLTPPPQQLSRRPRQSRVKD